MKAEFRARLMKAGAVVLPVIGGVMGCAPTTGHESETRMAGKPVLSGTQLQEARGTVDFERHVKPIIEARCLSCHNDEERSGGFSFESRFEATMDSRIVPGNADESLAIIFLTTGNHSLTMPAVGVAPPPEEIEVLERWINQGARWPAGVRWSG